MVLLDYIPDSVYLLYLLGFGVPVVFSWLVLNNPLVPVDFSWLLLNNTFNILVDILGR
jgi:hypothetical protein